MAAAKSASKAQGKQEIRSGGDHGGHEAFRKAAGTENAKSGADYKTPYKHR